MVPTVAKSNQVRRLLKLARLLEQDELVSDASEEAKALLLGVLREVYERLKDTEALRIWPILGRTRNDIVHGNPDLEMFGPVTAHLFGFLLGTIIELSPEPKLEGQTPWAILVLCAL